MRNIEEMSERDEKEFSFEDLNFSAYTFSNKTEKEEKAAEAKRQDVENDAADGSETGRLYESQRMYINELQNQLKLLEGSITVQ